MIQGHQYAKELKASKERDISEFNYDTKLKWKLMKKIKSETSVRAWHIKVGDNHYRLIQTFVSRYGERLAAYKASRGGTVTEYRPNLVFETHGEDWLHGIEYLLRTLEGQDISSLKL